MIYDGTHTLYSQFRELNLHLLVPLSGVTGHLDNLMTRAGPTNVQVYLSLLGKNAYSLSSNTINTDSL